MCYTRGKCFRVILGLSWDVAPFLPVGMWAGPKISILAPWKIFNEWSCPSFSDIVIDQKGYFWCDFSQFEDGVFEKNPLFCIPIWAQKGHFWPLEGLFLAKNLEKIVFSVDTIQNFTFWNPNVAPQKVENFGPTDPPWHPPTPPDTPQGSGGAKNGQNAFPQVHWW